MKKVIFISFLTLSVVLFVSCNSDLSRSQAKEIIIEKSKLPIPYTHVFYDDISVNANALLNKGLIINPANNQDNSVDQSGNGGVYIPQVSIRVGFSFDFTELGKKYLVSQQGVPEARLADIDFDEITGITKNEQSNVIEVHYTLKYTNLTPFGEALLENSSKINKVAYFEKYDDGWRIQ